MSVMKKNTLNKNHKKLQIQVLKKVVTFLLEAIMMNNDKKAYICKLELRFFLTLVQKCSFMPSKC